MNAIVSRAGLLLAIAALVTAACGGDDDDPTPTSGSSPANSGTAAGSPTATRVGADWFDFDRATTTPSGLKYVDERVGTGISPRPDQLVAVNYTGRLATTGKVFDSSEGKGPASFALNRVIKGFGEGILTMKEGGKRVLYIPASLAYGASPPPGSGIPANADLIFEVELVSVK